MPRPKKNILKKIDLLSVINESFDSVIKTDFKIVDYSDYFSCEFISKNGNKYDLEFHYTQESSNILLNNGLTLGEVCHENKELINSLDIAFTLSNIEDKDNPEYFGIDTNIKEQFDVFGRIVYIIKNILKRGSKYKLFVIGGDTKRNRLSIYKKIFYNHFIGDFDVYEGDSDWHNGDSLFIIKNNEKI
jgi:hypothetical protein